MEYELVRSKQLSSLRIAVDINGAVRVRAPLYAPEFLIKTFIRSQYDWIARTRDTLARRHAGATFIELPVGAYKKHKERARRFIEGKVAVWDKVFGFGYGRISIRNQQSRWGSCSASGHLSFNYKLLFLDERLADYVIVHELAHLAELNHSKKFWDIVESVLPHYKELRRKLRLVRFSTPKKRSSAIQALL